MLAIVGKQFFAGGAPSILPTLASVGIKCAVSGSPTWLSFTGAMRTPSVSPYSLPGNPAASLFSSSSPATDDSSIDGRPGPHFRNTGKDYVLPHPIYSAEELSRVKVEHRDPSGISDRVAYLTVQTLRKLSDLFLTRTPNESKYLNRFIYLETVAGVPGMVAGMWRHMHSLRRLRRDNGWIHTLLEEAENERMHLLTWLEYKKPSFAFRSLVLLGQGAFFNAYFLAYLLSPKTCHRFVGYLEEEAVKTYTHFIDDLDAGRLPHVANSPAPDVAIKYWKLPANATIRDVAEVIRADEAVHRDVNHSFSSMPKDAPNPFL